jgi:two-component system chemotaxis response regulator CheY
MTRILVLDDNTDILKLVRTILEQSGFHVTAGRHGKEGLDLLHQADTLPDLILSNWFMPYMDGITFLDAVRSAPEWAAIPFVMMTAATTTDRREMAFARGANGFLSKPFLMGDLRSMLNDLGIMPNRN